MRRPRRPFIPQRRRVFLGCEGDSERGYGGLISRLLEEQRRDVHLDVVLLKPGGGDPLALVERALKYIRENEHKRNAPYVHRALLLDGDTLGRNLDRDARIHPLAMAANLRLIWQEPCHEALLLRHFSGCDQLRPQTANQALTQLRQQWPEYAKGMPAVRLELKIGRAEVRRIIAVETRLAEFLAEIGYDAR
jgi:hypothetical protein